MPEQARKTTAVLTVITAAAILSVTPLAAEVLHDPTRPSSLQPADVIAHAASAALKVSAVFVSGKRRVAIVNGRRLRIGDQVSGATVTGIERNKVDFERDGKTLSVTLVNGAMRN